MKLDRIALLLAAIYVLALCIAGWKIHVIETPNSAEMDGYAAKAELILAGEVPRDPYQPLLYPILSAAVGAIAGGAFAGARIVSALGAGLMLSMTYLAGKRAFGREAAFFAFLALMLNHNVVIMGMEAATDMTFAGLSLAMLFLCLRLCSDSGGYRNAAALGLGFALALFTRYSGFFLLPAVFVALATCPKEAPARRRFISSAIFAAAALAALVPHFILTERAFGTPWYSESWRNLAMKMHGGYDWRYFRDASLEDLRAAVASSPGRLMSSFFRELIRFFSRTLPELGGGGIAGFLFTAAALAGLMLAVRKPDREKGLAICYAAFYAALGCFFFYSGPRLMLPLLPVGYLFAGALIFSPPLAAASLRVAARRVPISRAVAMLILLSLAPGGARHLRAFARAHPIEELEAARFIERTYGHELVVLGTFPFMQRYVGYRYAELATPGGDTDDRASYFDSLRRETEAAGADYVVVGKLFLKSRPPELLDADAAPSFLEPVHRGDNVVVYRVLEAAD